MDRKVNLKGMSVKSAFHLAIANTDKTQEEIMDQMGWTPTVMSRFLSFDGYLPSFSTIPKLCKVLGNTIIVDWLIANLESAENKHEPMDARDLLLAVATLAEKFGNVATECRSASLDDTITIAEAKRIIRKVKTLSQELSNFYLKLDPILYEEE